MVSDIGLNFHSTFWYSACRKVPINPATPCWIMTTGTICLGLNPSRSSSGVMAVPKPMPAVASMNSKAIAIQTTLQMMAHSLVPAQPIFLTKSDGMRWVASNGLPASQQPIRNTAKRTSMPQNAAISWDFSGMSRSQMVFSLSSCWAISHPFLASS